MKRTLSVLVLLAALALALPVRAVAREESPEATVSALWRAMANEPGSQADVGTLRRLFHADAVIFGGRHDGLVPVRRWTAEEFLAPYTRTSDKGFHECERHRVVHRHGRFATVYSVVESRSRRDAVEPDFVGVNAVSLIGDGTRWQVLSLYYYVEDPSLPIPATGRSGQCLD